MPDSFRHRILLIGNPAARPDGLERLLVRGGFQVTEGPSAAPPDLLLYTPDAGVTNLADEVRALVTQPAYGGAPVFVVLVHGGSEAATEALLAGAQDVLLAPVHLSELRERLESHIRSDPNPRRGRRKRCGRANLLFDIFQEVSAGRARRRYLPDAGGGGSARRSACHIARSCSRRGEDKGRVVAVVREPGAIRTWW